MSGYRVAKSWQFTENYPNPADFPPSPVMLTNYQDNAPTSMILDNYQDNAPTSMNLINQYDDSNINDMAPKNSSSKLSLDGYHSINSRTFSDPGKSTSSGRTASSSTTVRTASISTTGRKISANLSGRTHSGMSNGVMASNGTAESCTRRPSYKEQNRFTSTYNNTSDFPCIPSPEISPLISHSILSTTKPKIRHRKHDDDRMSGGTRCCFGMLMLVAQVLLHGVLALTLYWIIQYRSSKYEDGSPRPFAWREDPELEWNMHPVLMVAGFIYFMGEAMLMYRTCRCCRRIWTKLLHSIFHILAIPCIAMGFLAAWDYHSLKKNSDGESAPIQHFYSLHSWLGLATMGLFVLQFVVGFFSFLLLLCCESATASFRAALVPVHSTFGTTTFLLAIATCVAGLTEKAYFVLSFSYTSWVYYALTQNSTGLRGKPSAIHDSGYAPYTSADFEEALIVNVIGGVLVILAIVIPCIIQFPKFRVRRSVTVIQDLRYQ